MDPPFSGFVLDPSKCRKLSVNEKRELVHELSKWPESAPEKLQTWSRRDILEILCAELGKERKYTGLSKQRMIEYLFRVVCKKNTDKHVEDTESIPDSPLPSPQPPPKRQRKSDHPSRLPIEDNDQSTSDGAEAVNNSRYCQNIACRAILNLDDTFCRRCSCCICHKYDDNKDPSLWLFCSLETPHERDSCGLSCHLECALKHERAGIAKNGQSKRLDGSYYCIYCGKENDLLGYWKKQLMIAKNARRVDVLCYRLFLSHKLLSSTEKYQALHDIVEMAMRKLEAEVGPITGIPTMARGIVNRLSVGAEVQKLCASAVEKLDSMLSGALMVDPQIHETGSIQSSFIKFEGKSPTSLTMELDLDGCTELSPELLGFSLWHQKAHVVDYPSEPTSTIFKPKRSIVLTDLDPAAEYKCKVAAFSSSRELGLWEVTIATEGFSNDAAKDMTPGETQIGPHCRSPKTNSSGVSNPSSEGDESNNSSTLHADLNKSPESDFGDCENPEILDSEKLLDAPLKPANNYPNAKGVAIEDTDRFKEEIPGISASVLDEEPNLKVQTDFLKDSAKTLPDNLPLDGTKLENALSAPTGKEIVIVPKGRSDSTLPATPSRLENGKESSERGIKTKPGSSLLGNGLMKVEREPGRSSNKRVMGKCKDECTKEGSSEAAYEYCVKVVRSLECEGLIETNFRVKFLTWFSLRATPHERRIVSVYIDTLVDDPVSLAGQLADTFSEAIYSKRPLPVPTGFCMKLWH